MRLLDLDAQIQTWVAQDLLSVGHAKVLLGVKAAEEQLKARGNDFCAAITAFAKPSVL